MGKSAEIRFPLQKNLPAHVNQGIRRKNRAAKFPFHFWPKSPNLSSSLTHLQGALLGLMRSEDAQQSGLCLCDLAFAVVKAS